MTTEKQTSIVDEVVDGRSSVYGDPVDSMKRTAQIWSGILDFEVRPDQVPLMLMGLKLVRTSECPEYSDNSDDLEGYLGMFRKVVGQNMVHARSVSEYLEIKARREEVDIDDRDVVEIPWATKPPYQREAHSTDCIARMAVLSGRDVQCTCTGALTAGRWFQLEETGL